MILTFHTGESAMAIQTGVRFHSAEQKALSWVKTNVHCDDIFPGFFTKVHSTQRGITVSLCVVCPPVERGIVFERVRTWDVRICQELAVWFQMECAVNFLDYPRFQHKTTYSLRLC